MTTINFRPAVRADLEAIVAMYAKDHLGQGRENPDLPLDQRYVAGFEAVDADPNQLLLVAEDAGAVVGTMQITFIAGIARLGVWRAQVEAVRVHENRRGSGLGQEMFEWAIAECRRRGLRACTAHVRQFQAGCTAILRNTWVLSQPCGLQTSALMRL